jgi:sodium-dependent phosphate transporter
LLGGEVVKTIRKGIANEDAFADNPALLMWGCLCVLISVGTWLITASKFEMPVSTTHSCVGGMIGMAIALRGSDSVVWYKEPTEDNPLPGGFLGVVLSWFISPILSGLISGLLFLCVRIVLRSKRPFENALKMYPIMVFGWMYYHIYVVYVDERI